jgi:hypothetical protein
VRGALRVLAESCGGEQALDFANAVDPELLTRTALEALGLDVEERERSREGRAGNA